MAKESDQQLRERIAALPTFQGPSMLTVLVESRGSALDDVAKYYGTKRRVLEEK